MKRFGRWSLELLETAGYASNGSVESYDHKSCGGLVFDPDVHDSICPANGRGRTDPMLDGSPPPAPEPGSPLIS